jgi:ankyrin repeat protein
MLHNPPPLISLCQKNPNQCLSLCNTKHSLDTFWFLLQACWYLLAAVKSGDLNRTKIWVKYASHICTTPSRDSTQDTPLSIAADLGDVEVMRVLLASGAGLQRPDTLQMSALHTAARRGHLGMCRLLLDWGVRMDTSFRYIGTPLHAAAKYGRLSIVKLLVWRGADVRVKNDDGHTASEVARSEGMADVAEWLDSRMGNKH